MSIRMGLIGAGRMGKVFAHEWKDSFFGYMHGQGMDAVEFFTQKKVVLERWPREWTRKF